MLQLTIRCALSGATPPDYPIYRLSALLSLALLQPTMLCALFYSTLFSDTTTDSPLCFANRLSAALLCLLILQLTIHSALSGVTPTDYPLCSLSLLQPTTQSTAYPLYCLLRYFNRLCCVLCSAILCSTLFRQPILHSALSGDTRKKKIGAEKPNAFSRKPAPTPPFSR